MDKKLQELLLKFVLTIVVLLFVTTLLTKRFIYFRPSSSFSVVNETYKVINQGHLHGWMAEGPPRSKIILICHSNKGNVSHTANTIKQLHKLGFTVLSFDYSGFGKSRGIPGEQQLYDDASYMVALIRQTREPRDIILYGQGLGAPVATYVARRYGIPTLILISPFPSARSIVNHTPLRYISGLFSEFNTQEYLHGYGGRSLLIHSKDDEYIPYGTTFELQRLASHHIPSSGTHEDILVPWNEIKRFIENS